MGQNVQNREVVLHIGMHKTGTSAIQSFLSTNAERHLQKEDTLYVETGRDVSAKGMHAGHHWLAWSCVERYSSRVEGPDAQRLRKKVRGEIERTRAKRAVISSEFFWPARREDVKGIQKTFGGLDITVVIFVRNHLDMARSYYAQAVKQEGYEKGFKRIVEQKKWCFDYKRVLDTWRGVLGGENIVMELYDKHDDVVGRFAEVVGLSKQGRKREENVSPSDSILHFVRGLNVVQKRAPAPWGRMLKRVRHNVVAGRQPGRTLSRLASPFLPDAILRPGEREWFRQETKDLHHRFLESYVSPDDHSLFEF